MRTTLNKIRAHHPCKDGWEKLLRALNKTQPDDEPLPLEEILESNGFSDALWCLRAVEGHDREMQLYAIWCARQVQHLMADPRSGAALDVAARYARGQASSEELAAAREAAWEVAAARAAAREAARAAWAAASGSAVWAAAWDAQAQSAAAAWEAAAAAARAARDEAGAAGETAWDAARAAREAAAKEQAAIDAQVTEFRRVCREIEAGRDPYPLEAKP